MISPSTEKCNAEIWEDEAAGADELEPRFLNSIKHELACPLAILFQSITASESVSDDWKVANVVPVYKEGSRNEATSPDKVLQVSCVTKIFWDNS